MPMQKRDRVLSVKASVDEKNMIVQAAKMCDMTYSEFIRQVAVGAARNLGIRAPGEEEDDAPVEDDRRGAVVPA